MNKYYKYGVLLEHHMEALLHRCGFLDYSHTRVAPSSLVDLLRDVFDLSQDVPAENILGYFREGEVLQIFLDGSGAYVSLSLTGPAVQIFSPSLNVAWRSPYVQGLRNLDIADSIQNFVTNYRDLRPSLSEADVNRLLSLGDRRISEVVLEGEQERLAWLQYTYHGQVNQPPQAGRFPPQPQAPVAEDPVHPAPREPEPEIPQPEQVAPPQKTVEGVAELLLGRRLKTEAGAPPRKVVSLPSTSSISDFSLERYIVQD